MMCFLVLGHKLDGWTRWIIVCSETFVVGRCSTLFQILILTQRCRASGEMHESFQP